MEPLTGSLLISNTSLLDPNFRRTVVLIGHHDEQGAVGVVLNQPLDVAVRDAVPPLGSLVDADDPLFDGGPVQPDSVVVIADFIDPSRAEILALGSIGFLPPDAGVEIAQEIRRARVYAGYAGWGPGQLEDELEEASWVTVQAEPGDVFHDQPARLWDDVLRRLGRGYDMLRSMPRDPSMN